MSRAYIIDEILSGDLLHQVVAKIHDRDNPDKSFRVYYLSPEEYPKELSSCSIIEGEIFIHIFSSNIRLCSEDLMHTQGIPGINSTIIAVVSITRVIDDWSAFAKTDIYDTDIRIESEDKISIYPGDRVLLKGELELDLD